MDKVISNLYGFNNPAWSLQFPKKWISITTVVQKTAPLYTFYRLFTSMCCEYMYSLHEYLFEVNRNFKYDVFPKRQYEK